MVQHVGTSYHSYGDDVVRKLTDVCEVFRILNHFGLHKLSHEFPQEGGNFILQVSYPWLICLKHRFEVFQGLEDEGDVLGCTGGPLGCWDMCHSASPIQPSLHPHAGLANGAANHSHTLLQVLQCFGILMGSVSVNPRTPCIFFSVHIVEMENTLQPAGIQQVGSGFSLQRRYKDLPGGTHSQS